MRTVLGIGLVLSLGLLVFPALGLPWVLLLTLGGGFWARRRGCSVRGYLRALDDLAETGERALVALALSVMTLVVFVDVVWRTSHSVDGPTGWVFLSLLALLCVMGGLTARSAPSSLPRRVGAGLLAFLISVLLIRLIHAAPHGFGWSQRLALVLLLWLGLLGASLASKWGRHIQMDAVRRLVSARWRRLFEVSAELVTLGLLLMLTLLARDYAHGNWLDWAQSDYRAAVFESLPIPYLAASLPILIGFSLMLARCVRALCEGPMKAELFESLGARKGAEHTDDRTRTENAGGRVSAP